MAEENEAEGLHETISSLADLKEVLDGCDAEISDFVPALEDVFGHMRIGVPVSMEVGDDGTLATYLSYKRVGKRWRLCTEKGVVGEPEENWTTTPLSDLPREDRVVMFEQMPRFLKAVVNELKGKIDQRRKVIASTKTLVQSVNQFMAHQRRMNNLAEAAEPWEPMGVDINVGPAFGTEDSTVGNVDPMVQSGAVAAADDDLPGPPAIPRKPAKFPAAARTKNVSAGTTGRKL